MRGLVIAGLAMLAVVACGDGSPSGTDTAGPGPESGTAPGAGGTLAPTADDDRSAGTPAPESAPPDVALLEQDLAYGEAEGGNLTGFLAMPRDVIEPPPGVLVIHDRWGLNDRIRELTRRLASEGYIVLAVDLYDDEVTDDPARADALRMDRVTLQPEAVQSNLRQAHEYLSLHALAPRTAAIGWGLGGGLALQTALALSDELDAVVMYYGRPEPSDERLRRLRAPLLGSYGELDDSVSARQVRDFRRRLMEMNKTVDIYVYPDVGRTFENAGTDDYDAETAEHAWNRTLDFLERYLK